MTEEEKTQHEQEYKALLALFISMLDVYGNANSREEALYALSEMRAEFAINHVLKGLDLDVDEAVRLLRNMDDENLTQHDKDVRDRVVVAVDNLIDFAVCEEYQLYNEVRDTVGDDDVAIDSEDYEELEDLCEKYNDNYATVEDSDIRYAGAMAAWWIKLSLADYVVYWTQNDAKVRPWHMALQGYAAHVDEFPSWMIPPIEYNCRCYLESLDYVGAYGSLNKIKGNGIGNNSRCASFRIKDALKIKKPKQLSNVYSESLAKCGRIFGPSHPYFNVKKDDKGMLQEFVERIKNKWYGKI